MSTSHDQWASGERSQARSSTAVTVASAFSALTIVYGLALFHPPLVRTIDSAWASWSKNPAWALAIVALGAIVAAGSLALIALAKLTSEMQRAPFTWSAPLLTIVAGLALLQLRANPIASIAPAIFVASTLLLMLAGGSLLRIGRLVTKLSGALLLALPTLSVLLHYALAPGGLSRAWATAATPELLFALVLVVSALSMTLLALATASTSSARGGAEATLAWRERVLEGERKLAQAQRRAKLAERAIATFDRPAPGRLQPFLVASVLLLLAVLAGGYFSIHVPLLERARLQRKMLQNSAADQRNALEAARRQWASERSSLQALLSQEQVRTAALVAEDRALHGAAASATSSIAATRSGRAAKLHPRAPRARHTQSQTP